MEIVKRVLDAGITLVVLTQLVSLSDFLFSKNQKKTLGRWCDHITLTLDYAKPARWLQGWFKASRRANLTRILFYILASLYFIVPTIGCALLVLWSGFNWWTLVFLFAIEVLLCLSWSVVAKVFGWFEGLFKKISAIEGLSKFVWVFLLCEVVGFVCVYTLGGIVGGILYSVRDQLFLKWFVLYFSYFYVGLAVAWALFSIDGLITLLISGLLCLVRLIIILARTFMWRVSDFEKGPLAALTVVTGALLAVVRVALGK